MTEINNKTKRTNIIKTSTTTIHSAELLLSTIFLCFSLVQRFFQIKRLTKSEVCEFTKETVTYSERIQLMFLSSENINLIKLPALLSVCSAVL